MVLQLIVRFQRGVTPIKFLKFPKKSKHKKYFCNCFLQTFLSLWVMQTFSYSTSQSFLSRPWYFYVSAGHAYTLSSLSVYTFLFQFQTVMHMSVLYLSLSDRDAYYPFSDRTCILLQLANCEMMNVYQYKVAMFHISQALQLLHIRKTCLGNKK